MRISTLLLTASLAVLSIGGASAQRGLRAPRITVQSLEPLASTGGPQRFRVELLIDNQNTDPLRIRSLEFELRLADQGIVDGQWLVPLVVEALDRQIVTVEVGSDIVSSLSRLLSFAQGPASALPYEIRGTVQLDRRFREPLPFGASGHVPLVMNASR